MADFSVSFAASALERSDAMHINSAINAFLADGEGDEALLAEGRTVQNMTDTDRYNVDAVGKTEAQREFLTRVVASRIEAGLEDGTVTVDEDDDD